jgi:hypothetical protein
MPYDPHPLAKMFPLDDGENLVSLREDIRENGQLDKIILYKHEGLWTVLDGRRRQLACIGNRSTRSLKAPTKRRLLWRFPRIFTAVICRKVNGP